MLPALTENWDRIHDLSYLVGGILGEIFAYLEIGGTAPDE